VVTSAGLLLFRRVPAGRLNDGAVDDGVLDDGVVHDGVEVLIGHMGGPFWARKDTGAWSIPKGEYAAGEDAHDAAVREFTEEIGRPPPPGVDLPLGTVQQRSGKSVTVWARAGDLDVTAIESNTFELEWPPHSGRRQDFPELDRAQWFPLGEARRLVVAAQAELLDRLEKALAGE